jgi:hypothetical protein
MSLRQRVTSALLTIWVLGGVLVYFRQFAAPALRFLSRSKGLH